MKTITSLFILSIFLFLNANAQTYQTGNQINVQVMDNSPEKAFTNYIALDILGSDFDWDFRTPAVYAGINGRWDLTSNLTLEGAFRPTYSFYGDKKWGLTTEANVYYPFNSKTIEKEIKVVTGFSQESDLTTKTSTTKFFNTDGDMLRRHGARGGLFYKRSGMQSDAVYPVDTRITQAGIFIGLQQTRQALLKTKINNEYIRYGAGFTRIYADFMLLPGSGIADEQVEQNNEKSRAYGYRVGMQFYVNPHNGEYKLWGASMLNAEIGSLPYIGFYVTVGYAIAIYNRKK